MISLIIPVSLVLFIPFFFKARVSAIITSTLRFLDSDVVAGSKQPGMLGCKTQRIYIFLEHRGVIEKQNLQVLHEFIGMTDTLSLAEFTHDKIIIDLSQGKRRCFL